MDPIQPVPTHPTATIEVIQHQPEQSAATAVEVYVGLGISTLGAISAAYFMLRSRWRASRKEDAEVRKAETISQAESDKAKAIIQLEIEAAKHRQQAEVAETANQAWQLYFKDRELYFRAREKIHEADVAKLNKQNDDLRAELYRQDAARRAEIEKLREGEQECREGRIRMEEQMKHLHDQLREKGILDNRRHDPNPHPPTGVNERRADQK